MNRRILSPARLSVSPRTSGSCRCAYCHGTSTGLDRCPGCGVLTHLECRSAHGRCPTLGCVFLARDFAHRAGLSDLQRRIAAKGLLIVALVVLATVANTLDASAPVVVAHVLSWVALTAVVTARGARLCREATRLLESSPELMLMTVRDEGDSESTNWVATFLSPGHQTRQTSLSPGFLLTPGWVRTRQTHKKVLVYGVEGSGPFVVARPGSASLAIFAPLFGKRFNHVAS